MKNYNLYQIYRLNDDERQQAIKNRFICLQGVLFPLCEEIEKRGYHFAFSVPINSLSLQQMSEEIKNFCVQHAIDLSSLKSDAVKLR